MRVLAETPGPPAGESAKMPHSRPLLATASGLERSASPEIYIFSVCARFHFFNRNGLLFFLPRGNSENRKMTLHDKFGRQITDLRISVTDRCNFRCIYCRSADPENYQDHDKILSWAELERLGRVFYTLGIRKLPVPAAHPPLHPRRQEFIPPFSPPRI